MSNSTNTANTPADMSDVMPDMLAKLAHDAFVNLDKSSRYETTARQTLAYCIMVRHADDVANDAKPPALSALKNSPKAARKYIGKLAEVFIGKRPDVVKERSDVSERARKQYQARYAALQRAVVLAGDLITAHVDHVSFDRKSNMFRVAPEVICDPNMEPIGALAKQRSVLIDGTAYMVERGGKVVSINASLSRVTDAAAAKRAALLPPKAKPANDTVANGASDTTTTGGAKAEAIVTKLETFSFDALLVRAARIANEPSDGPARRAMFTDEAWNALEDLVAFYEEVKRNEHNAQADTPVIKAA